MSPISRLATLLRRTTSRTTETRSLDAAGSGRRWTDDRQATGPGVVYQTAPTIGARAQHFALNTSIGARITEALVGMLIGAGIVPRSRHPAPAIRETLQLSFSSWTDVADADGRTDFYGQQAQFARDLVVLGEFLAVWSEDTRTGAPQLRRLHPEQLDRSVSWRKPTGYALQGVEFDLTGRIVAYHIRPAMPGDALAGYTLAPERVPASEVIHGFRPLMPGQVRGLSWFAPVLMPAKELDATLDAMILRTKIAALHAGFITDNEGGSPYEGDSSGAAQEVALEPGSMPVLPNGKHIDFFPLPDQGGATALVTGLFRMIAAGAGVTFEAATGDYSQVNYSSARMAKMDLRPFIEGVQHHVVVFGLCRPVWKRFVRWQLLTGRVSAAAYMREPGTFDVAKWLPPAWPWIDPEGEAKAAEIALRTNLRSRSEIIAERGYDAEEVDAEIAADAARLKRLGVAPAAQVQSPAPVARAVPEMLFRADFRPASIDEKARTVELIASTGAGVVRYDIEGPFREDLIVSAAAIDMTRLEGMPLLDSHRQDSLDRVLGAVRAARVEAGQLIVKVEISARAEAFWQDIRAGIIRNVSVGYLPIQWKDGLDAKGARVRTVTHWELREVSLVPVGADPTARTRKLEDA
ncbi:phage portal protein [Pleomorphomonas sp. NRK KF1]|uniref:phage portal protein n=1 Tax=Pleomorphomonas sp. NRK KF1 TaxID=2943000 RepID=UPI002044A97D|nr:phage portal protein [Pleomorphomonas sp. NRK KF1]MCM5552417.1 phage portal protein [Pleomorphomonas sp. NRK KF1]